ncbi:unnamed protein product, partial [Amoebophrya sp. A120]
AGATKLHPPLLHLLLLRRGTTPPPLVFLRRSKRLRPPLAPSRMVFCLNSTSP